METNPKLDQAISRGSSAVKTYDFDDRAGCVEIRIARQTGTRVGIYHAEQGGLDPAGGAWVTVCEEHGTLVNHVTLRDARWQRTDPMGWCEECRTSRSQAPPQTVKQMNILDETFTLKLTGHELMIIRACVDLAASRISLDELFPDEDFAVTDGDDDVERPTDAIARKLDLHRFPEDPEHVLPEIRKVSDG